MLNHILTAALAFGLASFAPGQNAVIAPASKPVCVTDNIDWLLPADFAKALARSKAEHRLLLIKGVSFGIDVAGAACATKGKW